jgi:hypothetical protein
MKGHLSICPHLHPKNGHHSSARTALFPLEPLLLKSEKGTQRNTKKTIGPSVHRPHIIKNQSVTQQKDTNYIDRYFP